jgi:nucleotide-binding universal stress UspA family protein
MSSEKERATINDEVTPMFRRMLIPLDGSKTAEAILPYARFLAGSLKLPVELLSAIDLDGFAPLRPERDENFLRAIIENTARETKDYLEDIARSLPGITTSCFVEKGKPEEVIIEKAADDKETLIAMATHGRSGINRWLLGSVTEKVMRATTGPLLVVRGGENGKPDVQTAFDTLVVPLDGSELAESVLPIAVALAKALNVRVVLARAYELPMSTYASAEDYYISKYGEFKAMLKGEAGAYLEAKVNELKGNGVEKVYSVVLEGSAPEQIIDLARKTSKNLVAMCTHGRSGVKRWVLGSVTEKVVRHSGDPVLIIPAKGKSRSRAKSLFPEPAEEVGNVLKYTID